MKSRREQKNYEERYTDAADRAAKHGKGASFTCFQLPKDMEIYKWKAGTNNLDFVAFLAGKDNPMADEGKFHYERTVFVHKGLGSDGKQIEVCNTGTFPKAGKSCGGCRALEKMRGKLDKDTYKKLA